MGVMGKSGWGLRGPVAAGKMSSMRKFLVLFVGWVGEVWLGEVPADEVRTGDDRIGEVLVGEARMGEVRIGEV